MEVVFSASALFSIALLHGGVFFAVGGKCAYDFFYKKKYGVLRIMGVVILIPIALLELGQLASYSFRIIGHSMGITNYETISGKIKGYEYTARTTEKVIFENGSSLEHPWISFTCFDQKLRNYKNMTFSKTYEVKIGDYVEIDYLGGKNEAECIIEIRKHYNEN